MSEFLQTLSRLWEKIMTNAANTSTEGWLIISLMFATWLVLVIFVIRDHIKNPDRYKDHDKFFPPY